MSILSILLFVCLTTMVLSKKKAANTETQLQFVLLYSGDCADLSSGAVECSGKSQTETLYTGIHPGEGVSFKVETMIGGISYFYQKFYIDEVNDLFSGFGNVTFGESSFNYGLNFYIGDSKLYTYATSGSNGQTIYGITQNITGGFGIYANAYGWMSESVTVNADNSWSGLHAFNVMYPGDVTTTTPAPFYDD